MWVIVDGGLWVGVEVGDPESLRIQGQILCEEYMMIDTYILSLQHK